MSTGAGCCGSSAQQAASQHALHVAASVSNQVNDDLDASDTVDHSVRLEEDLAVFLDTQADQFLRIATALRELRQAAHNVHHRIQHVVGVGDAVEFGDVVVDGLQVLLRSLGEQDFILGRGA